MKAYLLDTNIASALWDTLDKDHPAALKFITDAAAASDLVYVSRVSIAEIEYGMKLHVSTDVARRAKADTAMRAYRNLREIGKPTTDPYSTIWAALFTRFGSKDAKGRVKEKQPEQLLDKTTSLALGIQENDLWIAAIAVEYHMILVTEDKMKRIQEVAPPPALTIVKWKVAAPATSTPTSTPPTTP